MKITTAAMIDLWPASSKLPVYATRHRGLLRPMRQRTRAQDIPGHHRQLGSRFKIGPFEIEIVRWRSPHPGTNALIIRTPVGTVMHQRRLGRAIDAILGDVPTEKKLRALGEEGCSRWSRFHQRACAKALAVGSRCRQDHPRADSRGQGRVAVHDFAM